MSLIPTHFALAEFKRSQHHALIPTGIKLEELAKPEFWAHVAALVKPFDRIEVRADDGSFWAELLVTKVDKASVSTRPIQFVDLRPAPSKIEAPAASFVTKFRGPRKWSVLRVVDQAVLAEDLATEDDANTKLAEIKAAA